MTKRSASEVLESPRTNGPEQLPIDGDYPFSEFANKKAEEFDAALARFHANDLERHNFLHETVKSHHQLRFLVEKVSVDRFLYFIKSYDWVNIIGGFLHDV